MKHKDQFCANDQKETADQSGSFTRLLRLTRPHLGQLFVVSMLMFLSSTLVMLTPYFIGNLIDSISNDGKDKLNSSLLSMLGILAFISLLGYVTSSWLGAIAAKFVLDIRSKLFSHLVQFSPSFFQKEQVGELNARIVNSISVIQRIVSIQIPQCVQAIIRFVASLVILLYLNFQLALIAFAVIPLTTLAISMFGRRIHKISSLEQDVIAQSSARSEEVMLGIATVQIFNQQAYEADRYKSVLYKLKDIQFNNAKLLGAFSAFLTFFIYSVIACVFWYGGILVIEKSISAGELTTFLMYTLYLGVSIVQMGTYYGGVKELSGAGEKIFELMDKQSDIKNKGDLINFKKQDSCIDIKNLSFSYSGKSNLVLSDINISIKDGENVAIVGHSGSGKSTLLKLLVRFFDAEIGEINLNGRALRDYDLHYLRNMFGIVSQEIFLFSGTIMENIKYAKPDATDEEVKAAICAVGADKFIALLEHKYDEHVGTMGDRLSAGQRQLIAIARAYLKDPRILLLDEATSALDSDSEQMVQNGLIALRRDRTTITIAHRLATVCNCDNIIIIEKGRVIAQGSHSALLDISDVYKRYWRWQSQAYG